MTPWVCRRPSPSVCKQIITQHRRTATSRLVINRENRLASTALPARLPAWQPAIGFEIELAEDALHVDLDGAFADHQRFGNLAVAHATRYQRSHFRVRGR